MTKLIEFIIYAVVLIAALTLFKSATDAEKQIKEIKDSMVKFEAQQTVNELTNLYRQLPTQ